MKRALLAPVGAAALLLCAGAAWASGTVYIGDYFTTPNPTPSGQGAHGGGAFTISLVSGFAGTHVEHGDGSVFQSFCLETGEDLHVGQLYNSTVDADVITGLRSANTLGNNDASPFHHHHLEAETKSLYYNFRNGTLPAAWNSAFSTNPTGALDALQAAIWGYQEQVGGDTTPFGWISLHWGAGEQALINLLVPALQSFAANPANAGHGVAVLNLTAQGTGANRQSVLVLVPLPGTLGMATASLGGMLGLSFMRRRRA
jgi:hypothetical protein